MGKTVSFFAFFAGELSKSFWTEEKWQDSLLSPPARTVSSLMSNTVITVFEDCCGCHWGNASLAKADASLSLGHVLPHDECGNRADLRSTA